MVNTRVATSAADSDMRGKRVGMVVFSSYPADPRPRRAIETLLQEGMTIDLVCLKDDIAPAAEKREGLDVIPISITHTRGGKLSYAYQYCRFIAVSAYILAVRSLRRRYDLIYVHNMPDVLVVSALLPKLLGAKVILDQHDPMPELMMTIFNRQKSSRSVRLLTWLEKWSIRRADRVITVNIACKRIFGSRSCSPDKIGIVMNSPDESIFPFRAVLPWVQGQPARDRFVIMYHGSLVERNGLDLAVEALALVRRSIPNVQLKIYGRGTPFLETVMARVRTEALEDCVTYCGPRMLEDVVGEIEKCDLGVIPNQRSAFSEINTPTRIFEYLALGKPVIAPRAGGVCDYFDERSMVLFELGDAQDLADKIKYVISHPSEMVNKLRRGQEVYQRHCWATEKQRLTRLVSGLLAGRSEEIEDSEAVPAPVAANDRLAHTAESSR